MKKLTLSLIIVILASIFGLGIAIDNLFNSTQTNDAATKDKLSVELAAFQTMGAGLAKTIDEQQTLAHIWASWPQQDSLELSIEPLSSLYLPSQLRDSFYQGNALILHNDNFVTMQFYLATHQQVLTLTIVPQSDLTPNDSWQLVFTSLFYAGILLVILIWVYPLINQLTRLKKTTHAFGQGKLSTRIQSQRFSYTADIEHEFNRMAKRIEALINDNKLLSDAVSHDLRTPLSRLRFGIEALQETNDPTRQQRYQQHLCDDIDEMEQLVNVLLEYARLDSLDNMKRQPADLTSLLTQLSTQFEFSEKKFTWHISDRDNIINANATHLRMLLNNLIVNAGQHAKSQVAVSQTSQSICIEDDGKGIPVELRQSLLKPFVRGEQDDENTINKGYGMGLAIAARIADLHGASLIIDDSPTLTGARITIQF